MAYYDRDQIERVSAAIAALTYREMLAFCEQLTNSMPPSEPGVSVTGLADCLSSWAEDTEEAIKTQQEAKD